MRKWLFIALAAAVIAAVAWLIIPSSQPVLKDQADALPKSSITIDLELVNLESPKPNSIIRSPLEVVGEVAGFWFFEADFPIKILDANENELGIGIAQAIGPSMTVSLVPFEATVEFKYSPTPTGFLILEKDNPTGFEENDQEIRYPVRFR